MHIHYCLITMQTISKNKINMLKWLRHVGKIDKHHFLAILCTNVCDRKTVASDSVGVLTGTFLLFWCVLWIMRKNVFRADVKPVRCQYHCPSSDTSSVHLNEEQNDPIFCCRSMLHKLHNTRSVNHNCDIKLCNTDSTKGCNMQMNL